MKKIFTIISLVLVSLLIVGGANAATTIGTNINTGGTVTAGGNIILQNAETISNSTDGTITLTAAADGSVNVVTSNLKVGNGTPTVTLNGEDAYVEGTLEVDGAARLDSTLEVNNTVTLSNDETIDNATDGTINFTGKTKTTASRVANDTGYEYFDTITGNITGTAAGAKTYGLYIDLTRPATADTTGGDIDDAGLKIRVKTLADSVTAGNTLRGFDVEAKADNPSGTITNVHGGLVTAKSDTDAGTVADMWGLSVNTQNNAAVSTNLLGADIRLMRQAATEPTTEYVLRVRNESTSGTGADAGLAIISNGSNGASSAAFDYGIDMASTTINTAEIRLSNEETIKNTTNGTIALTADSTTFSGDITVTGNDITFGNTETISNTTNNVILITSATTKTSGDLDIGGKATTTAASGNIATRGTLTVGTDGVGTDVLFYTDSAGEELLWDASENQLTIDGTGGATALAVTDGNVVITDNLTVNGTLSIAGGFLFDGDLKVGGYATTTAANGNIATLGTLTAGVNGVGTDFTLFTDTAGEELLWDASENQLAIDGTDGTTVLAVTDGNVAITDSLSVTGATTLGSVKTGNLDVGGNATTTAANGNIDTEGTITAVTLTDGTVSFTGGAVTGMTGVTSAMITNSTIAAADLASGAVTAPKLQAAAADLGAADVTVNFGNTNGAFNTNITLDGTLTAGTLTDGTVSFTGGAVTGMTGVTSAMISDNVITATDLNATLTFADSDLVDLSAINGSGATEGLKLPQATDCSAQTAEGLICWDTDDNALYLGDGAAAGAITNAFGATIDNAEVTADTINFTAIADALTLDAATTISAGGALALNIGDNVTLTTTGSGVITATTAAALAANPNDCGANTWATTIAADGTLTCAAISGGAGVTDGTIAGGDLATDIAITTTGVITANGGLAQKNTAIADGDATPSVAGGNIFTTSANTGATEITDLDLPVVGSIIYIIGGSDTNSSTISDAGNFALSGAWTAALDDVLILYVQADNDYIELGRVNN